VKPVLRAAGTQTSESATVAAAMQELMQRAKESGAAAALQRDATARIAAALQVFRTGSEATTTVVAELTEGVELLRERMAALSREVARFRV
jgi:polyhydroxyalkanoate synthesis regulator phasin